MPSKILVTGGAGFIGSAFVRQVALKGQTIAVADKLTYAGDLRRIAQVRSNCAFYKVDICKKDKIETVIKAVRPHIIVHCAAETHVDRSIRDSRPFIETNVTGTQNLIDLAVKYRVKKFLHISTDEVYGENKQGRLSENAPIKPGNLYAASKAAAEQLIYAGIKTCRLPAIIIRPSNNYGPWQYPEKLIPLAIYRALKNKKISVYGKGEQIREWIYVEDCVRAIDIILRKGKIGEAYNIGSGFEQENISTVKTILTLLNKHHKLVQYVKDRPGHDFRYSINSAKVKKLGWKPEMPFTKGIRQTIEWNSSNLKWLEGKF